MIEKKQHRIVTFGEVLMRVSPPQFRRFSQAQNANIFFGGTEANVAVAMSHFDCKSTHVTALPNDFTGEAVAGFFKQNDVDTQFMSKNSEPLGLYFLEEGATHRSSKIVYNRNNSAFANCNPKDYDWKTILKDADWFHWTGITPATSKNAYIVLKEALSVAQELNITVSADPVYRSNLWKYDDANPAKMLKELVSLSHVFIGGCDEINMLYETNYSFQDFKDAAKFLQDKNESIKAVINKTRKSKNGSWHTISSQCWADNIYYESPEIEITHIIDRIGTGDAFAAGLIYGMLHYELPKALAFANTTCALKHSMIGDAFLLSKDDVEAAIKSGLQGRIIR